MRLPRFVLGMLGVLLAFALVTYYLTGAFWATAVQTIACAVLVQAGYFLVILFLVSRTKASQKDRPPSSERADASKEKADGEPATHDKIGVLPTRHRIGTLRDDG